MKRPRLSIVMTVFDRDPLVLENTFRALLRTDLKDTEVIVVDDGSTYPLEIPRRFELLRAHTVRDCPDVWHDNGYKNPAHAFNVGWREATGMKVVFMSSDCIVPPNLIVRMRRMPWQGRVWTPQVIDIATCRPFCGEAAFGWEDRFAPLPWFLGAAYDVWREIEQDQKVEDENYMGGLCCEDNDLAARLCLAAGGFLIDRRLAVFHQPHRSSVDTPARHEAYKRNLAYCKQKWGGAEPFFGGTEDPLVVRQVSATKERREFTVTRSEVLA